LIPRHVTAALTNVAVVTGIPVLSYCGGIFLTGDLGGPLNLMLVLAANIAVATAFSTILFVASLLSDRRSSKLSPSPALPNTALLAVAVLAMGCLFIGLFATSLRALSAIQSEQAVDPLSLYFVRFAMLGGFPLVASIPSYMLFDRMLRGPSGDSATS
jgi:hypothetical protein